ncbi:MAG: orotidine 5'-phosphate decarboxylase [Rickettsiales bacterium]|jgi:orotidine-5'-phosphate decarboxylase|nr:orotidine 5'-phosphate decarboxylase [Rickettsiales bacterium]
MHAVEKLKSQIEEKDSRVIIGLDPDKGWDNIVNSNGKVDKHRLFGVSTEAVMVAREYIIGVKPNIAYWTALGAEDVLGDVFRFIADEAPELVSILDAKFGDIGATQEMSALTNFNRYKSDMTTINAYMGTKSTLAPFIVPGEKDEKTPGLYEWKANHAGIVVAASSNPDAAEFQDMMVEGGLPNYVHMAMNAKKFCPGRVMAVVGATQPEKAEHIRKMEEGRDDRIIFLCPGLGPKQKGEVSKFVAVAGLDATYPVSSGIMSPEYRMGMSVKEAAAFYKGKINEELAKAGLGKTR